MFNRQAILTLAKDYDSFYLYDESQIKAAITRLKRDFEGVTFLYSLKANSHPLVLKTIFAQGWGADAASAGEVALSHQQGLPREKVFYSAPGKSKKDIAQAFDTSILVADSLAEMQRIEEIAEQKGRVGQIGLRINPEFTFTSPTGMASKFGIDEALLFEQAAHLKALKHVEIVGIHVHIRSQELKVAVLAQYYENVFALAKRVQAVWGVPLQFINLGSGLGVPYAPEDQPLDTAGLGKALIEIIHKNRNDLPEAQILIESGRYVVSQEGVYATKVLDKKMSHGKTFVILANTLNGFMRPALAQWMANYAQAEALPAAEPLFTSTRAYGVIPLTSETETERVTLAGNLCTATDVIARDVLLPRLVPGDVIVIPNAGSYAAVLSPLQFSSQTPPAQFFLSADGRVLNPEDANELA